MEVFYTSKELKSRLSEIRTQGRSVGFVPTMGSLHSGHASLLHLAKSQSDAVVLSIYVNPTQFNNPDDFASYPHMLQDDLELAQLLEVDFVCVLAMIKDASDPFPLIATGTLAGTVKLIKQGSCGFGYDPMFYPEGSPLSLAQITPEEKSTLSHRGLATKTLRQKIHTFVSL